jgi:hypothetical protein
MNASNQKYQSLYFLSSNKKDLKKLKDEPWLQSDTIIIKPNWVSPEPAGFTSKNTLKKIIESLDSKIIVTESFMIARSMNILKKGLTFQAKGKEVNWDWLLRGEGWNWLYDNPSWEWFIKEGHWDHILKEDQYFRDIHGFSDLFQDYDIEYVNVTDEVWNGRYVDPFEIKTITETKYNPVQVGKMYEFVPKKLFKHAGATLISLNRVKQYATFSLKNMFGLIPDPMRSWWHGPDSSRIVSSIVDINKIYFSIFNVLGMCASIDKTAVKDPKGEFVAEYAGRYSIVDGFGFVVISRDLVYLDSTLLALTDNIAESINSVNVEPVQLAEKEGLGIYNKEDKVLIKKKLGNWISL